MVTKPPEVLCWDCFLFRASIQGLQQAPGGTWWCGVCKTLAPLEAVQEGWTQLRRPQGGYVPRRIVRPGLTYVAGPYSTNRATRRQLKRRFHGKS